MMKDNEQEFGFDHEFGYELAPESDQESEYEELDEESEYETEYDQEQEYEYVPDPVYQYEQDIDDSEEGGNYWDDEPPKSDLDENDRSGIVFTPWMITGAVVIVLLAILIGVSLWHQKGQEAVDSEKYQEILASLEQSNNAEPTQTSESTESETAEASSESAPESTESSEDAQESSESSEVTPGPTPSPSPTPTVSQNSVPGLISGDITMHFDEVNDTVTALTRTNLRSEPNTQNSGNVVAQLGNGQNVTRIGVNAETGWSKLEYNGQIVFAATQFLVVQ